MTKSEIEKEFDAFFEFDTEDRSAVSSVSAKLFAECIARMYEKRGKDAEREECAKVCDETYYKNIGPEFGEVRHGIAACASAIRARSELFGYNK